MIDFQEHLNTVWDLLGAAREDLIPEGEPCFDEQWNDVCHAMAVIRDGLGLESEVSLHQKGAQS
jgi:hypothetical protein